MCIIVVKPKGSEIDEEALQWLDNCAVHNQDGAGYMFNTPEGTVRIEKGFMGWDSLLTELRHLKSYLTDTDVVFHFRFATHGAVTSGNCHPFPVTADEDDLRKTTVTSSLGLAHNGVINEMKSHTSEDLSDSMAFVARIVAPNIRAAAYPEFAKLLSFVGSKFAILTGTGFYTSGVFSSEGNWLFSNDGYKDGWSRTSTKATNYAPGGYSHHNRTYGASVDPDSWYSSDAWTNEYMKKEEGQDKPTCLVLPKLSSTDQCGFCNQKLGVHYVEGFDIYLCSDCLDQAYIPQE